MSKKVIITDRGMGWYEGVEYFRQANDWAQEHCVSYRGMNVFEADDFCTVCNHSASYIFDHCEDTVIFKLRWQK